MRRVKPADGENNGSIGRLDLSANKQFPMIKLLPKICCGNNSALVRGTVNLEVLTYCNLGTIF